MIDEPHRDPSPAGADEPTTLEALTTRVLPALIAQLRASRLGELEVRSAGWRVRLRRAPASTPATRTDPASGATDTEPAGPDDASVARSPAVGYFAPATDLEVGSTVTAGDVLGSVDVLGIIQEVTAPADGVVNGILAEPGQAVEYGQALVGIDSLEPLSVPVVHEDAFDVATDTGSATPGADAAAPDMATPAGEEA